MKHLGRISVFILMILAITAFKQTKPRVLVFSKTKGYKHHSIPVGRAAIMKLGAENGFDVDTTTNADFFTKKTLKKYAAVVFLNTTGDVLNPEQQSSFEHYIQAGGGYAGVHAASDTEYDWSWYGGLVGGYFMGHPPVQDAVLNVVDQSHKSSKHLQSIWKHKDEWYNFKNINPKLNVLITIDEKSYSGGKNGDFHPMSWYHDYDGGRAWYTGLGHTMESYSEDDFLKHLLGGIQYAMGKKGK